MNRETKIDKLVDDLRAWVKRDPSTFWEHVSELEKENLEKLTEAELDELLQDKPVSLYQIGYL